MKNFIGLFLGFLMFNQSVCFGASSKNSYENLPTQRLEQIFSRWRDCKKGREKIEEELNVRKLKLPAHVRERIFACLPTKDLNQIIFKWRVRKEVREDAIEQLKIRKILSDFLHNFNDFKGEELSQKMRAFIRSVNEMSYDMQLLIKQEFMAFFDELLSCIEILVKFGKEAAIEKLKNIYERYLIFDDILEVKQWFNFSRLEKILERELDLVVEDIQRKEDLSPDETFIFDCAEQLKRGGNFSSKVKVMAAQIVSIIFPKHILFRDMGYKKRFFATLFKFFEKNQDIVTKVSEVEYLEDIEIEDLNNFINRFRGTLAAEGLLN